MIPQEIIDRILDRVDIVEVISGFVPLKKTGRNFKACCPFHNEKTPSFVVSPDKQIFHCFGCGAGGNAIGFVMKYENMDFPESVKMLAAKAGVELPVYEKRSKETVSLAGQLYEVNKIAASFFQNNLHSEKGRRALEYLKKRGLDSSSISKFRIGYALDEWESLREYCTSKKIPADLLRKAGLAIPSEKGKGDYDRFRNRITFPIFNERDHIVGFGARVMDDSLPKYINSPETVIYNKSNILYGLNFSRKFAREKGYVIIAEGYLDVIIPSQHGVTNVVAASGTALTPAQVAMLKKYTDTAVMVFDADQAGEAASLRGLDVLIEKGMRVRIAALPKGDDPDSFVRKKGKEAFEGALEQAKDLFDYKLDLLVEKYGMGDIGRIADEMLPTISRISNLVVQSSYLKKMAERLGVHEQSLRIEVKKVKPGYSYHHEDTSKAGMPKNNNLNSSESYLLGLAILDKKMYNKIKSEVGLDLFHDENVKKAMMAAGEMFKKLDEISPGKLLSRLENDENAKRTVVAAVEKVDIENSNKEKMLADCILSLKKENRDAKLKDLTFRLKEAQRSNNGIKIKDLLSKINKIHKERVA